MGQEIRVHELSNGLVLLAEEMDWVESAAFTIALPAGCIHDPTEHFGLANFACEMTQRGCGDYDSRRFVDALDRLGADRSSSATAVHSSYSAAMLAENLNDTLKIFTDLVRQPHLPASQLEEGRSVCFHELQSLEDDLAQRAIQSLKEQTYPNPWGRSSSGTVKGVSNITIGDIQSFIDQFYVPNAAVISVAGNIDWPSLKDSVESLFGDWAPRDAPPVASTAPTGGYLHIPHESSQTHVTVAYNTVPYRHSDYFQSRGAVGVLSDGMSSRLFTEVREVRGLCYSVFASYHSLRNEGRVLCYAGTSTERAQETLDVMLAELVRLKEGIDESELTRLKARVRSALIMQQEMSAARSGAIAADWYHLGRVRTMDEVSELIDSLTCDSVNGFLAANPPGDFCIVTLGQKPLEVRLELS